MKETTKALLRRMKEDAAGIFPWKTIFSGNGIDVGSGDNPLELPNVKTFDTKDGDANFLSRYFTIHSQDFIHASQLVEHLFKPIPALLEMLILIRPGGHMCFTVPCFDLYEKRCFPSKFNGDHKAVFSMWRKGFPGVKPFYHMPTLVGGFSGCEILRCELITTNYDWNAPETLDQTYDFNKGVECFIEVVMKVKP